MRTLFDELRFAIRALAKRPGLTLMTALTLGLGIGLTVTMFSVVNGTLWRGLPVERSDRVMHLERAFARQQAGDPAVPLHDFLDWRAGQTVFVDLAAFAVSAVNVSGTTGPPERYGAAYVTANIFGLLGVQPLVGRGFREEDDRPGAPPVAIVSDQVWRDHFDRRPNLDGLVMRVGGESVPVVGVMPARFRFPFNEDVWLPLRPDPGAAPRGQGAGLEVIGRLKDGMSLAGARSEFAAIAARLAREYPATNGGVGVVVRPYVEKFFDASVITLFYMFLAGGVGVLLIACVNVANLLLAAASRRTREIAIRTTLGASRMRVITQLLIEVFVLTALGAAVGVLLADGGIRTFNAAIAGTNPPFWLDIRLDRAALLFVLGLIVLISLAAGLYPAIKASSARASGVLKDETRGGTGRRVSRLSRALVMVEVALSGTLLVAAGLLVRSVTNVQAIDFGFSMDRVLVGSVILPPASYPDETRQRQFWTQLLARLEQQAGVRSATLCTTPPGLGSGRLAIAVDGVAYASDRDYPLVRTVTIAPRFFETFDVALLEGRDFGSMDSSSSQPVGIVNRKFADRYFPEGRALGRRLRVRRPGGEAVLAIVGLAPDLRMGVRDRDPEALYLPLAQWSSPAMSLAVRAHGEPQEVADAVRGAVATLDPDLPVFGLRTMQEAITTTTWFYGTFGTVFVVFGGAALVLAIVGLHGLMAFSVTQRTREFGIRLAMGARPIDVLGTVVRQALVQVGVGLAAGVALAAWTSGLLAALLVGVNPRDPIVYALIAIVLVLTGLLAVAGPAIRAARTNPTDALRHE